MSYAITTDRLSRSYGRTDAVHDLTLHVPVGSVFALVGPNGAGKTTTIKVLMNLLQPSRGRATVLGTDSRRVGPAVLTRIGYVSENQDLPGWMTVRDLLDYCAPFYPTWDAAYATALARQLEVRLDWKIKACSRGMRMKAALLVSLAYRPELLIMDEPFAGLDALVREEFAEGILEVAERERPWTVLVSSHDIDEVERLADWIGIINHGRLELAEPVADMLARFRRIDVLRPVEQPIPPGLPTSWLRPQAVGRVIRFTESAFDEAAIQGKVHGVWPDVMDIQVTPLPLREIFIALARQYRLAE